MMSKNFSKTLPLKLSFLSIWNQENNEVWWPCAFFQDYSHLSQWNETTQPLGVDMRQIAKQWIQAVQCDARKASEVIALVLGPLSLQEQVIIFSSNFGEQKQILLCLSEMYEKYKSIPGWIEAVSIGTDLEYNAAILERTQKDITNSPSCTGQFSPVDDHPPASIKESKKNATAKTAKKLTGRKAGVVKKPKVSSAKHKVLRDRYLSPSPSPKKKSAVHNMIGKRKNSHSKNQLTSPDVSVVSAENGYITISSFREIINLLRRAGYRQTKGKFCNPNVNNPSLGQYVEGLDYFSTETAFRKNLCAYGVECTDTEWSKDEEEKISSWIRYSIVVGLRGKMDFVEVDPLGQNQVHSYLLKLGYKWRPPYYIEPGRAALMTGGLFLSGGYLKDGDGGLWTRIARFGLPSGCDFSKLSSDERMKLELYFCDCPSLNTLYVESIHYDTTHFALYSYVCLPLCLHDFSARLERNSEDPAQSTSSSFHKSPTTETDYGATESSPQHSKVADVEDVTMQPFTEDDKTNSSATVISKATVDSCLTIHSTTSCTLIPCPRTLLKGELNYCPGFIDTVTYQQSSLTQQDEFKGVHSAPTGTVQEDLCLAESPTPPANYAFKHLLQHELSIVKPIAAKNNSLTDVKKGDIDVYEMKAEENCVLVFDGTGVTHTDFISCQYSQRESDAQLRIEQPCQSAEAAGGSIGVDLDGFAMNIEQDTPCSGTIADDVTAAYCADRSVKSFDYDYITQSDADSACYSDTCTNTDVASQGSAPLKTQDAMPSDWEGDSSDDDMFSASLSTKASYVKANEKQKTVESMAEITAEVTSREIEIPLLEFSNCKPELMGTTTNIKKNISNVSTLSSEVTMRISSPSDSIPKLKSDVKITPEVSMTSASVNPSQTVDVNWNLDIQNWKAKVRKEVKSNDEWRCVMGILKYNGLSFQKGNGLVSFYYKFPNGKSPRDGGIAGVDFLENEDDVKDLAVKELGWNGGFEYARLIEKEAKRLSSRPTAIACTSQANSPLEQAKFKLSRKIQLTSPMERPEKRIRNHQNEPADQDRVSSPERKRSLKERLLCCQKALQDSFAVTKMTSSPKIQQQLDAIDSFLNSIVASNSAIGAATCPSGSVLYIAGAPGVGKTSAVKFACKSFENAHQNVTFCNVSASLAKSRINIMGRLANSMSFASNSPESKIQDALQTGCSRKNERRLVVMVIDEIDYLLSDQHNGNKKARNESEETLVTLMEWATNKNLSFALIGISNVVGGPKAKRIRDLGMVRNIVVQRS